MTTMIRTLRYGKGYSGKLANKCWVARIGGSSKEFGLTREFLEPVKVERASFTNPRTIVIFSFELEQDQLYELRAEGERWIVMCYEAVDGSLKTAKLSDARIKAWVAALDGGMTGGEARVASKGL